VTGQPILIDTSFGVRGKPIGESPADALASAVCLGADAVVMGSFVMDINRGARH
jgi:carbamoyltransferase